MVCRFSFCSWWHASRLIPSLGVDFELPDRCGVYVCACWVYWWPRFWYQVTQMGAQENIESDVEIPRATNVVEAMADGAMYELRIALRWVRHFWRYQCNCNAEWRPGIVGGWFGVNPKLRTYSRLCVAPLHGWSVCHGLRLWLQARWSMLQIRCPGTSLWLSSS